MEEIEKEGKELIAQLAKLDVQIALLEERQEASYLPNIREHGEFGLDTQGKDQLFDELRFLYDMTLA